MRDGVIDGIIDCAGGHCCGPLGWNHTCLTGASRSYLMLISASVKRTFIDYRDCVWTWSPMLIASVHRDHPLLRSTVSDCTGIWHPLPVQHLQ